MDEFGAEGVVSHRRGVSVFSFLIYSSSSYIGLTGLAVSSL